MVRMTKSSHSSSHLVVLTDNDKLVCVSRSARLDSLCGRFRSGTGDSFLRLLLGSRELDVPDESHFFHQPDDVPGDVELPPFETVSSGTGEGVVVVVKAFAAADDGAQIVVA